MALADVYFPDTPAGRTEAYRLFPDPKQEGTALFAFCREYEREYDPLRYPVQAHRFRGAEPLCARRDPRWLGGTNRCRRCPAGFAQEAAAGLLPADELSPVFAEVEARGREQLRELEEAFDAAL